MKKRGLLIMGIWALLCVATGTLSAQYTVSGTVSDERTGEPLLYANVVIQNSAKGTVTDLDGKFSLEVDSDGEQLFKMLFRRTATET